LGRDGVFGIDRTWIAIESIPATVSQVEGQTLNLDTKGRTIEANVIGRTEIQDKTGRFVAGAPASSLRVGDQVYVIGFNGGSSGTFTASRIFRARGDVSPTALEREPTKGMPRTVTGPDGPLVLCPLTWHGLASFFCCGGVNSCSGSGGAWCSSPQCFSYNHRMAWKNVKDGGRTCNATCGDCCDTTLSQFNCGTNANLANPCNSMSDVSTIVDCGPNLHCHSAFGCNNRTLVKFDLTPCSFAALGGDFGAGLVTCDATLYINC
jgi:hypothetical protein